MVSSLYLLIFPALVLGIIAVGDRCTRRLGVRALDERLGLALAAGMAVCSGLVTLLGALHLLRTWCAWVLLVLLTIVGLRWIRRNGQTLLRQLQTSWSENNRFSQAVLLVCVAICALNAWLCLSPEIRHDTFDYHLTAANLYTVAGEIVEIPWHVFTYMPKYGEILYAFILLLGPDILGKLLHWSAGVGVLLLTSALGQRLGGRSVGLIAAFLVAVLPLFSFLSTTCYVDLFVALWALAAILCLVISGESGQPRFAAIAGSIFLGMVLGAKYVAWATVAAPVLIALVVFRTPRQGALPSALRALCIAIGALLVASPWLLYNMSWTGNPTYPLFGGIFGRHIPPCVSAEAFFRGHSPPPEALTLTGYVPYLLMRLNKLLVSETVLVFFSGFLAALYYLCRCKSHTRRFLAVTVLLSSLVFLVATDNHDGRFFFPTLSLCAVLTGLLLSDLLGSIREAENRRSAVLGGYALAAALFVFWIPQRMNQIKDFDQKIIPRLSTQARETLLRERFPGFELVTWADENLTRDTLVLGLGYPLQRRYVSKNKYGYIRWLAEDPDLRNPDRLADVLRQAGVTHIATPWPSLGTDIDLSILLHSHLTEVKRTDARILYALD